jgi:hypothetical protein
VHSTRKTSIRTRKTLGEDSFVYSMSMAERGEAPDGMAGIIHYEACLPPHYGTGPAQKKRRMCGFREGSREPKAETGL